jgi:hypothetical protein
VIVTDPVAPDFPAVQVLRTELAVNGPGPTLLTDAVLVTERLPLVLTRSWPHGGLGALGSAGARPPKRTAGPYWASAPATTATTAVVEPPGGSVTDGLALALVPGGIV